MKFCHANINSSCVQGHIRSAQREFVASSADGMVVVLFGWYSLHEPSHFPTLRVTAARRTLIKIELNVLSDEANPHFEETQVLTHRTYLKNFTTSSEPPGAEWYITSLGISLPAVLIYLSLD